MAQPDEPEERSAESSPDRPRAPAPNGGAKKVFLASTNDALRPLRRRLTRDLMARGIGIVDDVPPPYEGPAHEAAVRAAVRAADLTVHLLDEEPGEAVEDRADDHTYAGEQLRIGLESAQSQLVLVPEQTDFTRIVQPAYAKLIDSLSSRPRDAARLQLVRVPPTLMLDEIAGKLKRLDEARQQDETPRTSVDAVFVDLHGQDMPHANDLIAYLMRRNIAPVLMPALGESPASAFPLFEDTLKRVQMCIVVYGGVNRDWVLHRLNAAVQVVTLNGLATRICVYVAPPTKTADVLRFPPFYEIALGMDRFDPARLESLLGRAVEATS
jgi:hypothetical protein